MGYVCRIAFVSMSFFLFALLLSSPLLEEITLSTKYGTEGIPGKNSMKIHEYIFYLVREPKKKKKKKKKYLIIGTYVYILNQN